MKLKKSMKISCQKEKLIQIRQFAFEVLRKNQVGDMQAHKMVLAVDEVCSNIMIHSNNCDPSYILELEIEINKEQIIFTFRDEGQRFDINDYKIPSISQLVSKRKKGGLGLMLVKQIMDKIEFSTDRKYNICRLIKLYP